MNHVNASLSLECMKELPKEFAPSRDDFSVSMAKVEEPLSKLSNSIPKQHHAAYDQSLTDKREWIRRLVSTFSQCLVGSARQRVCFTD